MFECARTSLALTAAYHPSADGQSKWTNQTIEIALRCILANASDKSGWERLLSDLEYGIGKTTNSTTKETPYKILYGVDHTSGFLPSTGKNTAADEFIDVRNRIRADVADAIRMA